MVPYDPKAWPKVMLAYAGTVIPSILSRLVLVMIVTLVIYLLHRMALALGGGLQSLETIPHQIVGVTVGFLIVFRTSTSYDRYWEGRRLWGNIVNCSRNLVREAAAYVGQVGDLAQLVTAYPLALKQHLRGNQDQSELKPLLPEPIFAAVTGAANPPATLAYYLSFWIQQRRRQGVLEAEQLRLLEQHVATIIDSQGGCERILRTPIPFAYAAHIKQLLLLYLITLPFVLVPRLDWITLPIMLVISWGLLGIEEAGVEIEDPFGDDPNDLPIEAICATIARDVQAMAQMPALPGSSNQSSN